MQPTDNPRYIKVMLDVFDAGYLASLGSKGRRKLIEIIKTFIEHIEPKAKPCGTPLTDDELSIIVRDNGFGLLQHLEKWQDERAAKLLQLNRRPEVKYRRLSITVDKPRVP